MERHLNEPSSSVSHHTSSATTSSVSSELMDQTVDTPMSYRPQPQQHPYGNHHEQMGQQNPIQQQNNQYIPQHQNIADQHTFQLEQLGRIHQENIRQQRQPTQHHQHHPHHLQHHHQHHQTHGSAPMGSQPLPIYSENDEAAPPLPHLTQPSSGSNSSRNNVQDEQGQLTPPTTNRTRKSRSKYSSPCDACSFRKVKCDQKRPCSKCIAHNIPCTNNRMRKRSGPKNLRKKTRELIGMMTNNPSIAQLAFRTSSNFQEPGIGPIPEVTPLTIDKLLPFLQVFQTWYYGVWPVVSMAHLVAELTNSKRSDTTSIELTESNTLAYSLSCAIAAAIDSQVKFLTTKSDVLNLPNNVTGAEFAEECVRSRSTIEFRLNPTAETLLTSFFLYAYYVNIKLGLHISMVYLREAISMAQIMGLHDASTYDSLPAAEGHRLRKIYYMLLVTERFMCISDNLPVILEAAIPFPELDDEEYPTLLSGFSELVKVFAIPDKRFFDRMISSKSARNDYMASLISSPSSATNPKWLERVQNQLSNIRITNQTPENQQLNILLSKYWMMSLAWHVSQRSGLIVGDENDGNCFSVMYPIKIARDFIDETSALSIFAFESNGPGVCIKLLEIALGLMDTLSTTMSSEGFASLYKVFMLVNTMRNDITLPVKLFEKVEKVIQNQVLPTRGYISELTEEDLQNLRNDEDINNQEGPPIQSSDQNYTEFSLEPEEVTSRNNVLYSSTTGDYFADTQASNSLVPSGGFEGSQGVQYHGLKLILSPFTLFLQFREQQIMPHQVHPSQTLPGQMRPQHTDPNSNSAFTSEPYTDRNSLNAAYAYPPGDTNSNIDPGQPSHGADTRDYRR